jgi:DNA polymerase III subunit delta'
MKINEEILDPSKTLTLKGLDNYFNELISLYNNNNLPKVTLLSGKKGTGKLTLINHFIQYCFDKDFYDLENKSIKSNSNIFDKRLNNIFPNVMIVKNEWPNKVKIDDIRIVKQILLKSTFDDKPRFIIFDDVELMSNNCANALLKIIEEPSKNNFFVLIDNNQAKLLETIASRCLVSKVFINNTERIKIIEYLINFYKLEVVVDYLNSDLTPGSFLKYNSISLNSQITDDLDFITKIHILLKSYKKDKNRDLISFAIFLTDQYYFKLALANQNKIVTLSENKIKTMNVLNDYATYNLNLNAVIESISNKPYHV